MMRRTIHSTIDSGQALPLAVDCCCASTAAMRPDSASGASFVTSKRRAACEIAIGDEPFATYVLNDPDISRPYFAHVRAPGGIQATRNQPPVARRRPHGPPHVPPRHLAGVWRPERRRRLAARRARRSTSSSSKRRTAAPGGGVFAVRNRYLAATANADLRGRFCDELFRCRESAVGRRRATLIVWDSTFSSDREFAFGDQEEMGLGFRVATPLRAQRTGRGRHCRRQRRRSATPRAARTRPASGATPPTGATTAA